MAPNSFSLFALPWLLTAIGLGLMLYALVGLLTAPIPGYMLGVKVLIVALAPLVIEFIVMLWIYRKRFNAH